MTVSVLVVDDSGFFRKRLTEILNGVDGIQVIGTASNGREGVEQAAKLRPDVITMDYEMPVMNGIAAVREIMRSRPTPVLMFSSLTYEGARVTLDALEAGAVDFLPKNFEDITSSSSELQRILAQRIRDVARSRVSGRSSTPAAEVAAPVQAKSAQPAPQREPCTATVQPERATKPARPPLPQRAPAASKPSRITPPASYSVVAIGTSTGGPIALQRVLTRLPANFPAPIVLVQHMPATFTPAFAERLDKMCQIEIRQACDGDELRPGVALLAPGGCQMMIEKKGHYGRVRILPADNRVNYKPSVDITFGSLARAWPGKTLAVILTGMGADGREGCRMMKETGSVVWAQDEKTSVIYGMPMAVTQAGLVDEVLALEAVASRLVEAVRA